MKKSALLFQLQIQDTGSTGGRILYFRAMQPESVNIYDQVPKSHVIHEPVMLSHLYALR